MAKSATEPMKLNYLAILPLLLFVVLVGFLFHGLFGGDPSLVPSPLIGRSVPQFNLPAIAGLNGIPGLDSQKLKAGNVTVVNIFASWCVPCHAETAQLQALAKDKTIAAAGVRVVGIAYKDKAPDTKAMLTNEGNPFSAVGGDDQGLTCINWGCYGVPETYVVKGDGTILYKYVGPISAQVLHATIVPEIEAALK
ncbi:MAG: DsbE family thiol:disulfide interchange protein [Hyphomicrobiales bacterium]|nr:DsbE family thiol:disulfide interchange protein [Hyphomicrobiales bacterium]MDE2115768.1 DsbE family thiol:disulfide interchange protein [Hyphomicrobiales bacterium]